MQLKLDKHIAAMASTQRIKLSKSEAYSLIEDYFSSGELPSVFYRRVGLSDNQFYSWRKKYLRDHPSLAKKLGVDLTGKTPRNASYRLSAKDKPSVSDKGFSRVEVSDSEPDVAPPAAVSTNPSFAYELCYPNGVVLRLPSSTAIPSLAELIKLY